MARILFISSHLIGRARATGEFANRLTQHGHEVTVACPQCVMDQLVDCSAKCVEIPRFKLGGPNRNKKAKVVDFIPSRRRKKLLALEQELDLAGIEKLFETERPALAIIDYEMRPHVLVALGKKIPVAILSTMFAAIPGSAAPPLDSPLVPGPGQSMRIWWAWVRLWIKWRYVLLKRWRRTAGTDYLSFLRHIAKRRGVSLDRVVTRWRWHVPFAWRGLPLLVSNGAALDFPTRSDPNLRYVGPLVPDAEAAAPSDSEIVRLAMEAKSQGKKVIYVSYGSILTPDERSVLRLWRAIGSLADVVAIHSTGRRPVPAALDKPDNLYLVDWAPQRAVLRVADIAVFHGGVNTLVECVMEDTPMLSFPVVNDAAGNTARIAYHGLGLGLSLKSSEARIRSALRDLLDDPTYAERCAQIHKSYAEYEARNACLSEVKKLLQETQR